MPPPPWCTMMTGAPSGPSTSTFRLLSLISTNTRTPPLRRFLRSHCVCPGRSRHGRARPARSPPRQAEYLAGVLLGSSRSSSGCKNARPRSPATSTGSETEMKYIMIIAGNTEHASDGVAAPDALAFMQREIPKWIDEMDARGVRLFGRELDLPNTAATVRVRNGETLVTDGPFAETKEFMAGFDLLECSGLDEAVEVTAKSPITRFHRMEVRPFMDGLQVGEKAFAFGRGDDG